MSGVIGATLDAMAEFAQTDDPAAEANAALDQVIAELADAIASVPPASIIEVARLGTLPWSPAGTVRVDPESAPCQAEIVALIAVATMAPGRMSTTDTPDADADAEPGSGPVQPLTDLLHGELLDKVDRVLRVAQVRDMAETNPGDPLGYVSALMRGAEIWVRNTTYPAMLRDTVVALFADPDVRAALRSTLGFDAHEAIAVLTACHELQVDSMNARMAAMADAAHAAMESGRSSGTPDSRLLGAAKAAWTAAWEGDYQSVAVTAEDIARATGLAADVVTAVLKFFTLDLGATTPRQVVEEYTHGNNPLRTHPVVAIEDRFMLVHDTHVLVAVRENFEQHLKPTPTWDKYQKLRGDLLEVRTRQAFSRILPHADYRDGFEYFVPATQAEAGQPPSTYTKKVEGDHLILVDDVALIIEDKAVAVSPTARSGETRRLRRDLTGIVTKAADQSGRLRDRIVADKGVQIHGTGWLDLSHIREIHTIAVSLDDLTSVSTATAELVRAGILTGDNIPWTVSIHDLDLITQLVDHPAEFLLYLRRRRDPQTTVMFTAPDELDLFLHFFSTGLWVEPDPDSLRSAFPFLPAATTAERRRYQRQAPAFLTSHTDGLDQWYYAQLAGTATTRHGGPADTAPKPTMAPTPLRPLMDALRDRGAYGWLSTSATLLSGAAAAQARLARIPRDLLQNPFADGRARSHTLPWPAQTVDDGWLLVWMTQPAQQDPATFEKKARAYLRAKKHQLGIHRGVAFIYSEATKEFAELYFDDHLGDLDPEVAQLAGPLRPPDGMVGQVHPVGNVRSGSPKKSEKRKK